MPLNGKAFANLSLDETLRSTLGSDSAGPAPLSRGDSFDVSATNTFTAGELRVRGTSGLEDSKGLAGVSEMSLSDLAREKKLGRGASGSVVLMKHKETGERYALKELAAASSSDARKMAVNELRLAHQHAAQNAHLVGFVDACAAHASQPLLRHCWRTPDVHEMHTHAKVALRRKAHVESLVRVCADYHEGTICILMEYCDSGSLEDQFRMRDQIGEAAPAIPLGPVAVQLCAGLQYLHREMKQVHRDLKPANILCSSRGLIKLSDFGVSKQLDGTHDMAQTQVASPPRHGRRALARACQRRLAHNRERTPTA